MVAYLLDNLPHHLSGVPPDFVRHPAQLIRISSIDVRDLRPRSLPCPIGLQRVRTRLSAEVGRRAQDDKSSAVAPPTSGGVSRLDLFTNRRSWWRSIRRRELTASTSLPAHARTDQQGRCRADRSPRRRAAPPDLTFPHCIHHGRMRPADCHVRPGFPHRGWGESAEAWRA
jgi:hypothetical protein